MQNKRYLAVFLSVFLSGCFTPQLAPVPPDNQPDAVMHNWVEEQTIPLPEPEAKPEAAPEAEQPKKTRRPKAVTEEQSCRTETPAPTSSWQPNDAHLFRGKELIGGLKLDLGRQPTVAEIQQRLQSHMGLSAAQAHKLYLTVGQNAY